MITKVRNLRQSLEFGSNFEHDPSTTTGLSFGYDAGAVHNSGVLQTFAASTVTVPNGVSLVYVDTAPATATMEADLYANITSVRYIPLYEVTASGGNITNIQDVRGLLTASLGSATGTAP